MSGASGSMSCIVPHCFCFCCCEGFVGTNGSAKGKGEDDDDWNRLRKELLTPRKGHLIGTTFSPRGKTSEDDQRFYGKQEEYTILLDEGKSSCIVM